ncbi:MAG: RNA polymerase sigma factor [Bacteroidales bacterium]|nr:RNA polymerase sigma factor [Bacteroidales bacterium]
MVGDANAAVFSDEQLIEGCLRRDNAFREALYRKYAKDLYLCALRYSNCEEDAQDVLQDAFLMIFEHMAQFRKEGNLSAWMRTIVIRQAMHLYRRSLKRWQHTLPLDGEQEVVLEDPSGTALSRLQHQQLLQLVQELPTGYRMVFNLCEIEGYSYEEAAEMLHCSQANCRSQLARAKSRLRERINALEHI